MTPHVSALSPSERAPLTMAPGTAQSASFVVASPVALGAQAGPSLLPTAFHPIADAPPRGFKASSAQRMPAGLGPGTILLANLPVEAAAASKRTAFQPSAKVLHVGPGDDRPHGGRTSPRPEALPP